MAKPAPKEPARPFSRSPLTRQHLRDIVQRALEPLDYAHALWEGGSTAFGRDDNYSDVDLQVCVDDERVADTFRGVEGALEKAAGIDAAFVMPEPTWHGHDQRFYRFIGQPKWLMLDLCVQKRSNENRFLESEIHGKQPFLFDKIELATSQKPLDREAWAKKMQDRVKTLRAKVGMFATLAEKEARRQRALDAFALYHALILTPLVELLRISYDPWRHNFGMRYLHQTLPAGVTRRLEELIFIRNFPDLQTKQRTALRWFDELAQELSRRPVAVFATGGVTPARRMKR